MRPETVPTATEYRAGLAAVRNGITEKQFRMLRHHYLSPDGSATQRQLSVAVGYANYGAANLQYGLFAGKLAEAMGIEVNGVLVFLLSTFLRESDVADGEVQLVMRPELHSALEGLGWFAGEATVVSPVPTFLLTWNPAVWNGEITNPSDWSCGNNKRIKAGDRLFLIRQGSEPRGMVASGSALTDVFEDDEGTRRVRMGIDTLLEAETDEIYSRDALVELNEGLGEPMNWSAQISGTRIPDAVAARLEAGWLEFLSGRLPPADIIQQSFLYPEGAVRQITVNAYERSPEARRRCLEYHGRSCAVCGMSFGAVYGPLAEGFIHVHHLKPLSEVGEGYEVDPVVDLRPVCPNCHAVLHLGEPCRSIDEVQGLLGRQRHA